MLTKEEYEGLPEKARGAFTQEGDLFVPAKDAKLKQTLNELDSKYKEASSKLSEYEQKQAERQAEAERKALEKLKSEGKVDEILADAERRIGETQKQFQERIDKMVAAAKTGKRDEIVSDLSSFATDKGKAAFKRLIAGLIDYDPETGKEIYFNEDGSASSAKNRTEFMQEVVQKSETFEPLIRDLNLVTQGGGNAKGSNGDGRTSFAQGNMGGTREEREAAIAKRFKLKQ